MPKVVGILPMAGSGSRIAFPFHKALAPTIIDGQVVPLYHHAWSRLARITDDIRVVLSPEQRGDPCLRNIPAVRMFKRERGELPSSIARAAYNVPRDAYIALAFPDSMWWPEDGFDRMLLHLGRGDGILGLFRGSSLSLDEVVYDASGRVRDITRHNDPPAPDEPIVGWGCFIIRSGALRGFVDGLALSVQLRELDLGTVLLGGPYHDLGTPSRYIRHHAP